MSIRRVTKGKVSGKMMKTLLGCSSHEKKKGMAHGMNGKGKQKRQ